MGWSGGTDIMRGIIEAARQFVPDEEKRAGLYREIICVLELEDWDTQDECLGRDPAFDLALYLTDPRRWSPPKVEAFKPSAIRLGPALPLVGAFKSSEAECCAAWMIRICILDGDTWRPVSAEEIRDRMRADLAANTEFWALLAMNPFLRIDPLGLIAKGFAELNAHRIQFTEKGFEALKRWVRS